MPLLEWKDSYSVGIAAVDHEHRELIDLINTAHCGRPRQLTCHTSGN